MKPWCRWVGGKASQADRILAFMPATFDTYVEPMVGGGAVFWALATERERQVAAGEPVRWAGGARLSDLNRDLVSAWQAVQQSPTTLANLLEMLPDTKETYLRVRATRFRDVPDGADEVLANAALMARAVRFVFLNRCAFNGLWRENAKGEHNVPYDGTRAGKRDVVRADELIQAGHALRGDVQIRCCDYKEALAGIGQGTVAFLDPPYVPLDTRKEGGNFTGFNGAGFSLRDQRELEAVCREAAERGACVIVSQSDSRFVRLVWGKQGWQMNESKGRRNVNRNGAGRGEVAELILTWPGNQ